MSAMDFNDADEQRQGGTIPDGTFVKAALHIRPGGGQPGNQDPADIGLFKASTTSDAYLLDCEFTVTAGPFAHRKWWENMVVSGGSLDEKGVSKGWNMTKSRIRAMLESALAIDPKDMSDRAKAHRQIPNFKYLDGMPFYCKLTIEVGQASPNGGMYPDKNVIDRIIIPGDAEYADLAAGKEVAPRPRNAATKASGAATAAPAAAAVPAWGNPTPVSAAAAPSPGAVQQPAMVHGATAASPSDAAPAAGPAWLRQT